MTEALRFLNLRNKHGPWTILCDGESFLRAKAARVAYLAKKISLWFGTCEEPRSQPSGNVLGVVAEETSLVGFGGLAEKKATVGEDSLHCESQGCYQVLESADCSEEHREALPQGMPTGGSPGGGGG